MTDLRKLADHAVTLKWWELLPGMLLVVDGEPDLRLARPLCPTVWQGWLDDPERCWDGHAIGDDARPDFSDELTRLAVVVLVRRAWGDPHLTALWLGARVWAVIDYDGSHVGEGCSEIEALIAALEAAPEPTP